ncbi:MAG TPA: DUF58 domain-containing protein [Nitrososphaerales archaeon]|nr:DUF58 domain-containing protein [Nitrososphaerales archaeon]
MALVGLWISVITGAFFGLAVVPILLFVALDLRTKPPHAKETTLDIKRSVSETKVLMDDTVVVELALENRGPGLKRVFVQDTPPATGEIVRGSTSMLCRLETDERTRLKYEVRFHDPGEHSFGPCHARLTSLFGLAELKLDLPAPLTVRVYPRRLVKNLATGPAKAYGWSGITPSRYKGGRLDFTDIREYVVGDPLKNVNWRASARLGKTLVNEWRVERGLDCVVVVDLSSDSLPRVDGWSARPDVITAAYELTNSLVAAGNRVGMLVMGSILKKISPGFGSRHLQVMVENLVDSHEGTVWSMGYTEEFLDMFFRKQYTTRGGTLFFVFAWPSAELFETVTSLSEKGFTCNSILVDALGGEGRALEQLKLLSPEETKFGLRYARAEEDFYKGVLASSSDVFVWRAGEGFVEAGRRPRR